MSFIYGSADWDNPQHLVLSNNHDAPVFVRREYNVFSGFQQKKVPVCLYLPRVLSGQPASKAEREDVLCDRLLGWGASGGVLVSEWGTDLL